MTQERRMEYALANRRAQFRIAAENPAKMDRLCGNCSNNTKRAACWSSGSTSPRSRPLPRRSARPWSPVRPRRPSANRSMTAFAVASCAASCSPRSGTSPSTCPTRTCSFRCRGCSVRGKRKLSDSGASCGPRQMVAQRTSSPWFRAIHARKSLRITGSCFSHRTGILVPSRHRRRTLTIELFE